MKNILVLLSFLGIFQISFATTTNESLISELDPTDPNVEETLKEFDIEYERQTGLSPFLSDYGTEGELNGQSISEESGCHRYTCKVYIHVKKSEQRAYLYFDGREVGVFKVSTGTPGRSTPDFDRHPDGRVYRKYTSSKYPGGDYKGLGNMPYAVFIRGGYAIHGTPKSNWSQLGKRASHGCIRMHPDHGKQFFDLVVQYGRLNTWITVTD